MTTPLHSSRSTPFSGIRCYFIIFCSNRLIVICYDVRCFPLTTFVIRQATLFRVFPTFLFLPIYFTRFAKPADRRSSTESFLIVGTFFRTTGATELACCAFSCSCFAFFAAILASKAAASLLLRCNGSPPCKSQSK